VQVLGPDDLRLQYDLQPLMPSGGAAAGLTTVVLGSQEGTTTGDAENCADSIVMPPLIKPSEEAIQAYFKLGNVTATYNPIVLPNPDADLDFCGSNEEAQLDVEMQSVGAANAASINLVLAPASQVFAMGPQYAVNMLPKATVVSLSIGLCEAEEAKQGMGGPTTSGSEMQAFEQTVMQGLAEGQTWFAAAGDTGADDCNDSTSGTHNGFGGGNATVDFPGSVPEMIDVGGTQLSSASWTSGGALAAVAPEVAWNEQQTLPPDLQPGAGGGGQSLYYSKPSYQQGVGPKASDGARDVPDIALIAAAGTPGVAIYDCGSGQDQTCAGNTSGAGSIDIYGGTSVGSPLAAGIFALLAGKVGCRLGDIHGALYSLGKAQLAGGVKVFRDVTSGNNTFTDPADSSITGFSAGPGFDLVTGWGSPDATALTENWPACETKTTTTTTSCSSGSGGGGGVGDGTWPLLPLLMVGLLRRRRSYSGTPK
jgi:MYXO-CTERM domain-containing protein